MKLKTQALRPVACGAAGLLVAIAAISPRATPQDTRPLPDRDTFVREARERLLLDADLLAQYFYTEREGRTDYDENGKPEKRTEKAYEVSPSVGGSPSYRRLVSVDGVAVSRQALDAADRRHGRETLDWERARAQESARDRARREERVRADQREQRRLIDDGFRIYDMRVVGRETIRGRPAIVVTFTPRPGVTATVDGAAMLTKVVGRAWMDEEDRQMVRIEARSVDTITYGLGILARVFAGSTAVFERQKVNGEAWLPLRTVIRGSGRILLVKRVDLETRTDYADYRKVTANTAASSTVPKAAR